MTTLEFYREQEARQQAEADAALLDNARDRSQRAADAWGKLANQIQHRDAARRALDGAPAPSSAAEPAASAPARG